MTVSRRAALLGGLAAPFVLSGCGPRGRLLFETAPEPIVPLPDAVSFREGASGLAYWAPDFARVLANPDLDLLILGEVHDNPDHHAVQAWTVSMLDQLRTPVRPGDGQNGVGGLAFEMIPPAIESQLASALAQNRRRSLEDLRPIGQLLDWEGRGWPAWEMYAPILLAARIAPVTGGEVPRAALREALKAGAAEWPGAARFGLDQPLAAPEAAVRAQGQIDAHCGALPASVAPKLVDAQRIRDASLADALLRAEERGEGFSVLITGNGHARTDWGAPRFLKRLEPEKTVASVGLLEAPEGVAPSRVDPRTLAAAWGRETVPFDYIAVTPFRPRPDPCAAFRKPAAKPQ